MKQGNQFNLGIQIYDDEGNILTTEGVEKVVFGISNLTKEYTSTSEDVTFDNETQYFKIWLTEEETLQISGQIDIDARILYESGEILGCYITKVYFNPTIITESIIGDEDEEN